MNATIGKDHFSLPFVDQMFKRLAIHSFYYFLDGYFGYIQIFITHEDQKTIFTCPFGVYTFRRMTFGFRNAPATFQRCVISIFSYLVEQCMKIFMDDFYGFRSSFDDCSSNLINVLQKSKEKIWTLEWEKCHFMVNKKIVLGHVICRHGIEVNNAKTDLIINLHLQLVWKMWDLCRH